MEGCGEVGRDGRESGDRGGKGGVEGQGKEREGSTWMFVQGPRVPSYATIGPNGVSIDSSGQNRGQK